MIQVYPASSRYSADHGWLNSNFSFSFADYYDPSNVQFGPLRVFNDDTVQPLRGFGSHPHREMEIVSVVLSGQLQHKDNTGNSEILRSGEVQRMTAGTGIIHSETNPSADEPVSFLQLWFLPERQGLTPSYEQKAYDREAMVNALLPVVSSRVQGEHIVSIHQDMTIFLSKLEAGRSTAFQQESGRKIYVFVIEGELALNGGQKLGRRDAARIVDLTELNIESAEGAEFMLIDLP